jgi:hypothetical protein
VEPSDFETFAAELGERFADSGETWIVILWRPGSDEAPHSAGNMPAEYQAAVLRSIADSLEKNARLVFRRPISSEAPAMHCTRCDAAPALSFDRETASYAVATWSCPACGELHYDAARYNPYKVGGVVYVRRGIENRVAWPVNANRDTKPEKRS